MAYGMWEHLCALLGAQGPWGLLGCGDPTCTREGPSSIILCRVLDAGCLSSQACLHRSKAHCAPPTPPPRPAPVKPKVLMVGGSLLWGTGPALG